MVYRVGTGESSSQTKAKQNVVQTVATFALSSEPSKRDSDFAPDPDRDPDPVQTGTPQQTPKKPLPHAVVLAWNCNYLGYRQVEGILA